VVARVAELVAASAETQVAVSVAAALVAAFVAAESEAMVLMPVQVQAWRHILSKTWFGHRWPSGKSDTESRHSPRINLATDKLCGLSKAGKND
jgi:hypothetical protein